MAKTDKEKELGSRISELESANANLKKSKIQMGKDVERLTENEVKTKEVQGKLNGKIKDLSEAENVIEKRNKQIKDLAKQNQDLLTSEGQKSEQGDKIKSQGQEIEKLTRENQNMLEKAAKSEGEFPIFSDPSKVGTGRTLQISTVIIGKNKRLVVYKTDLVGGGSFIYQVMMEGSECVGVECAFVK